MKSLIFILLCVLSFTLSATENCQIKFPITNLCGKLTWIYGPYFDQYNSAKIEISDNSNVANIKVIPWMVMNHHEHGSKAVILTKTADQEYLVEKAYFMGGMDGDWFFKIQLLDKNNMVIEEARTQIDFLK